MSDPEFLETYTATGGFRLGEPARITPTKRGTVLFLRSGPRDFSRALFEYAPETGVETKLLDAGMLLGDASETLSAEERAQRERMRLSARGITSYELSKDGTRILVPLSGRLFVYQVDDQSIRELPSDGGYANAPKLSPNGRHVACVRGGDVWVVDIDMVRAGKIKQMPIERRPLSQINQAVEDLEHGRVTGRIVFQPDQDDE